MTPRFVLLRLAASAVVMAGVALLTFALIDLSAGGFTDDLAANPQVSRETIAQLRDQFGLDRPFYEKFWLWTRSLAQGDFGYSFVYQRPVRDVVGERLWNTARLNLLALAIAWGAGLALGIGAAAVRGSPFDRAAMTLLTILLSTPSVILAIALVAAAVRFAVPVTSIAIPAVAVAAVWLPAVARHARSAVLDALGAPHMLAARARGVGRRRLLFVHALREAFAPLSGLIGVSTAALLSASLPIEIVTAWPGIGQLTYDAVLKRDIFVVVDLVQLSALMLMVGNVAGDALLRLVDPRTAS